MKMKKVSAILLASVMAFGMMGCGSSDTTSTADSTAASSAAASTADSTAAGSTAASTTEAATSGASATTDYSSLSGAITGSGSSALFPLAQDAAEEFKKLAPNVSVTFNAGGSGTGLKQVSDGTVDIGNSDVPAEEKLDASKAGELVDHKVCVVSMAPVVNKDITDAGLTSLSKDDLVKVFTGEVTNWKDVGGPDEEITLVTRPTSSGTRALFKEYALDGKEEASNSALETDDSGTLLQTIKDTNGSVGYVALPYLVGNSDVSTLSIDDVEPTLENTYSGKWNVWGYEHMYTKGEADGAVKAYLDFITSADYDEKLESLGYGVTSKMQVER
ncbi:MAG: phosphate ABC transporter substrate-binding protein [Lachnospiraceae bacterium]|nr:phosphate ABC transporter substrate-binding protein [Lachnospiraceae bacterium]